MSESLFQTASRPADPELARTYNQAESLSDLFVAASERVCLAAYRLMSCFQLPRRGNIVLDLMKIFARRSYDDYWRVSNGVFLESAFVVANRLTAAVNSCEGVSFGWRFHKGMLQWAGAHWCLLTQMRSAQKEVFYAAGAKLIVNYEDNVIADTLSDRKWSETDRILDALERPPSKAELGALASWSANVDPVGICEPMSLALNLIRLGCSEAAQREVFG